MTQALKPGDRGQAVTQLQRQLNAQGMSLYVDGDYGAVTAAAVRSFQQQRGLVIDGVAGEKTLLALQGLTDSRHLTQRDLQRAADRLGVELAAIMAVNAVESRGHGFLDNGKPVILFERHVMYRRLAAADDLAEMVTGGFREADQLAEKHPGIVNPRPGGYAGGTAEHQRLALARQINATVAIESASWGLFQLMGFHWQLIGYESAQAFAQAMATSEGAQLDAFVRFIEADPVLHKALKARRWADFAKRYNGPEYKKNLYDTKLQRAYEDFKTELAA